MHWSLISQWSIVCRFLLGINRSACWGIWARGEKNGCVIELASDNSFYHTISAWCSCCISLVLADLFHLHVSNTCFGLLRYCFELQQSNTLGCEVWLIFMTLFSENFWVFINEAGEEYLRQRQNEPIFWIDYRCSELGRIVFLI